MFSIIEKSEGTTFNFSQNSVTQSYHINNGNIVNLLNGSDNENSKFATKKWYIIDREANGNYSKDEEIKFLTRSIESSLSDYSDAYILVTRNIAVKKRNNANTNNIDITRATQVAFKNCTPFENVGQK